MIRIPETQNHSGAIQTGFRLSGIHGILTALHGVADGDVFSAIQGSQVFNDLRVTAVDIKHDIALLTSDQLEGLAPNGLVAERNSQVQPEEALHASGFPLALRAIYTIKVTANRNPFTKLDKILPHADFKAFSARHSPSPDVRVLSVDGALTPGYSGAPLLNERGRVVAVVDGGLQRNSQIAWAIPLESIQLVATENNKGALNALAGAQDLLFCYPIDSADKGHLTKLNQYVGKWVPVDTEVNSGQFVGHDKNGKPKWEHVQSDIASADGAILISIGPEQDLIVDGKFAISEQTPEKWNNDGSHFFAGRTTYDGETKAAKLTRFETWKGGLRCMIVGIFKYSYKNSRPTSNAKTIRSTTLELREDGQLWIHFATGAEPIYSQDYAVGFQRE